MRRSALVSRPVTIAILVLQIIPLLLFPAKSFSPSTQEWWLPALLVVMVLIADFQLIFRSSPAGWPWYLIGFAQGFNIISRIMMVWSNAARYEGQTSTANWPYLILTFLSMALSALVLWYIEKPNTKVVLLKAQAR